MDKTGYHLTHAVDSRTCLPVLSVSIAHRLTVYECLACGRDTGMMEVVQDALTIANIQGRHSQIAVLATFAQSSIIEWLAACNPIDLQ